MEPDQLALLVDELVRDEGRAMRRTGHPGRLFSYPDSKGILSIGVGRNLRDRGISDAEADIMLTNDIADHNALLDKYAPWWIQLDVVRQRALANMAFNLGVGPSAEQPTGHLLNFAPTLEHIRQGNYEEAALHLETSAWYRQVGERAHRIVSMIRTGEA